MMLLEPQMFCAGAFAPDKFAVIQNVFRETVSETWFSRSPEKRRQFALFVLDAYRKGLVCPDKLRTYCSIVAKARFSEITVCIQNGHVDDDQTRTLLP